MKEEAILYLRSCVDEIVMFGKTEIDQTGAGYLIEAVKIMEEYLRKDVAE